MAHGAGAGGSGGLRAVVVGASLAGLRAAEVLAGAGSGEVVVIGDEAHRPYNRPPLSKGYLGGELTEADLPFPLRDGLHDVRWRLGVPAAAADLAARRIRLADGEDLEYDELVVATGVRPRRLDCLPESGRRFVLRSRADADRLRGALSPRTRIAVVGGGVMGAEIAWTAASLGCEVTVVMRGGQPMERLVGADLGAEFRRRHEQAGVRFRAGESVVGGEDLGAGGCALELGSGERIIADAVVETIGSEPNSEWLEGNGLPEVDADECLRLPFEGAFAAGDIVRFPHPLATGGRRSFEHWDHAVSSGKHVARQILALRAGEPAAEYALMPSFWSDQCGTRIQSIGVPSAGAECRLLDGDWSENPLLGYFEGDLLVGVISVGSPKRLFAYRARIDRMMRESAPAA